MTLGKYLVECMMIAVHEQLAGSVTVFFPQDSYYLKYWLFLVQPSTDDGDFFVRS